MDWTAIIVAVAAAVGTGFGSLYGIRKSNDLVSYRMDVLEKKMDEHNDLVKRVYCVEKELQLQEEKIKVANHRIGDLEGTK
jgi:hypothetical protein